MALQSGRFAGFIKLNDYARKIYMKSLQQLLWERWGKKEYPAEWDGREGGGGKGSQRFWEYLWALGTLHQWDKPIPARILDVGSGQLFFAELIGQRTNVDVVDPDGPTPKAGSNIVSWAGTIETFVEKEIGVYDWVTCISVLEHVEDKPTFCAALDKFMCPISLTFEFGEGGVSLETVYDCLEEFKNHYLYKMELCPVWADNSAINKWRPMGLLLVPCVRE